MKIMKYLKMKTIMTKHFLNGLIYVKYVVRFRYFEKLIFFTGNGDSKNTTYYKYGQK
jgi:hypothetical protein